MEVAPIHLELSLNMLQSVKSELASKEEKCGKFTVQWSYEELCLKVYHQSDTGEKICWRTIPRAAFVTGGVGQAKVSDNRGHFRIKDIVRKYVKSLEQTVDELKLDGNNVVVSGKLLGKYVEQFEAQYTLTFTPEDEKQLKFDLKAEIISENTDDTVVNRLELTFHEPSQQIWGFGEQFTRLNMKGHEVPVLCQEQGIGRGIQPLSGILNTFAGAGGSWYNSLAPAPVYMTSKTHRGFFLENYEYAVFDFTEKENASVVVHTSNIIGRIIQANDPLDLIETYTRYCGRMPALPSWVHDGAIIGMQGGSAEVKRMRDELKEVETPIAGYWLQDWVDSRQTALAKQLWWNWVVGGTAYPDWNELVKELEEDGARVLTYINPFLVDISKKKGPAPKRDMFKEAIEQDLVIKKKNGKPYMVPNTTFSCLLLDFTNPATEKWVKDVIKTELIGNGAKGWMADFGEALPFDCVLHDGSDPAKYHNKYPEEWARMNREAIEEEGMQDEILFFNRSGFTKSPTYSNLFWMGDQLASWSIQDGIKSTVVAMLSSGFSGFAFNHSDIGGYIATVHQLRIPGISFKRTKELLWRWIELNAFTSAMRTHEGNNPVGHYQIDGDKNTLRHFAKFTRVFTYLKDYKMELGREAAEKGIPVCRHPYLHFPDDETFLDLDSQFMLGSEFMIAPVMDKGVDHVRTYLPKGEWVHLWSGETTVVKHGRWFDVKANLGDGPAVFYLASSKAGRALEQRLKESGDADFESWEGDFNFVKKRTRAGTLLRKLTTRGSRDSQKKQPVTKVSGEAAEE